ncbi:hypothetical protein LR48_Vigan09g061600 [Vigna angularis]|uniref:Myb/SANT-like domain-containing protein n=1 Tax=Phaseolus angularis TaxID=3914 RepID=A0A0L9VAM7_PHAAN|nr:hypothetical protein LR48_Vigan09g061600 [Vigna angularis]
MNRGKGVAIHSSGLTREFIKWTEDMDAHLLHTMIEESRLGNRVDGSWTSEAYSNIVDHLHSFGIKHYDLMMDLWAADRATGSGVRTARQASRQRVGPRVQLDLNQNMEYISKEPIYPGYRDPTPPSPPPSVDEYSLGQTQFVPFVPSGGTSSSRGSKRKAPMVDVIDARFDKLTTSLDGFTNVLGFTNF